MKSHFARARSDGSRSLCAAVLTPLAVVWVLAVAMALVFAGASRANAAQGAVDLGTATGFAVLAGSTVTNTGPSIVNGDLGVSPGSAVTGFPPGAVNGSVHRADALARQARRDLTAAYDDAAGRTPFTSESGDLSGQTLAPGVYKSTSGLRLTGRVTLDAQGDPNAVFIFQMAKTLITGSGSRVALINGALPCNVFWQVGSSATLGTDSRFNGSILALTSITATTGASVTGRLLARNGAVTLDRNTITRTVCSTATTVASVGSTTTAPSNTTSAGTPTGTATATATGTPTAAGTETVTPSAPPITGTSTSSVTLTSGTGSPSASASSPGGETLAKTGADLQQPAAAGAGLFTLGGVASAIARRTRRR